MFKLTYSTQFKKDFKKVTKLAIPDILAIGHVITKLQNNEILDAKYADHSLTGNWVGCRDCHIKPDLVLIYAIENDTLQLIRIGSHSDLF